jgi:hypothetical protein
MVPARSNSETVWLSKYINSWDLSIYVYIYIYIYLIFLPIYLLKTPNTFVSKTGDDWQFVYSKYSASHSRVAPEN